MSWVFSGFCLRESSQNVAFSKVLCLNLRQNLGFCLNFCFDFKNCKFLVKFKRNLLNFTLKFTDEIVKNLKGQK